MKPADFFAMKTKWICLITVIKLCLQVTLAVPSVVDGDARGNCNLDFAPHTVKTSYSSKTVCAKVHPEKETWSDARDRCSLDFSYLSHRFHLNSTLHFEFVEKGIDTVWVGIRRRVNFFITENPPRRFRELVENSSDHWGYRWSLDEPGPDDCVAINVPTGLLYTRDCKSRLPFVCDDDGRGVAKSLVADLSCPDRWALAASLSSSKRTCVSKTLKKSTYEVAAKTCDSFKGRLATFEELNILKARENGYSMNYYEYWVKTNDQQVGNVCPLSEIKPAENVSKSTMKSCSLQVNFICVRSFKFPRVTVHILPDVMKPEPSYLSNGTDLLLCNVKADDGKSDLHGEILYQWYKDEIPVSFRTYVLKLSFSDDTLNRDKFKMNNVTRQGYYHCEVRYAGTTKLYSSQKVKFIYSDVVTYGIDINGIKPHSMVDYSKKEFFNTYIKHFDDTTMDNVMTTLRSQHPRAEWDFKNISVDGDDLTLKFVIYVYRGDVNTFDDRLTCEEVKEVLEAHCSIPAGMDSFQNVNFSTNCEDFPVTFAYRLTKSLRTVKLKIQHLEETQMEILESLKTVQESVGRGEWPKECRFPEFANPEEPFDPDLFFILRAIREMNRVENLRYTQAEQDVNEEIDERERNAFEDIPSAGRPFYLGSETKNFGLIGSEEENLRPPGVMSVQRKKLYYFPAEKRKVPITVKTSSGVPLSGRTFNERSSVGRIRPRNILRKIPHPENPQFERNNPEYPEFENTYPEYLEFENTYPEYPEFENIYPENQIPERILEHPLFEGISENSQYGRNLPKNSLSDRIYHDSQLPERFPENHLPGKKYPENPLYETFYPKSHLNERIHKNFPYEINYPRKSKSGRNFRVKLQREYNYLKNPLPERNYDQGMFSERNYPTNPLSDRNYKEKSLSGRNYLKNTQSERNYMDKTMPDGNYPTKPL